MGRMNQYFLPHYILIYNMMRIRKNNSVYTDFVSLGAAPIIPLQNSCYIPQRPDWSEQESLVEETALFTVKPSAVFPNVSLLL